MCQLTCPPFEPPFGSCSSFLASKTVRKCFFVDFSNNLASYWRESEIPAQCWSSSAVLCMFSVNEVLLCSTRPVPVWTFPPSSWLCWVSLFLGESALVSSKNGPLRWSFNHNSVTRSRNPNSRRRPRTLASIHLLSGNNTWRTSLLLDSTLW